MISHSKKSQDELELLFDKYNNLIVAQALFFIKSFEFDDLLQIARLGAIKAFQSYKEELGPMIPYLKSCVIKEILKSLKLENRYHKISDKTEHNIETKESISDYIPDLSDEDKEILRLKLAGYSRSDISKSMNLSISILNIRIHKLYTKIRESNI